MWFTAQAYLVPGHSEVLRSSFISYAGSKDWTWMSNQAAIEPGWLVDAVASVFNTPVRNK